MRNRRTPFLLLFLFLISALPHLCHAAVFNIQHFLAPGKISIGLEPELTFSPSSGIALSARYAQGISELSNIIGIFGTGNGPHQFRIGGAYTFDFFPELERQPGIGVAVEALYMQLPNVGSIQVSGIPYIRKSFKTEDLTYEPFIAIPIGISLASGTYQAISNLVLGSLFIPSEHISFQAEFGIQLANSTTYLSGGIIYNL